MSYIRKIARMERRRLEPWERKLDAELDAMKAADDDERGEIVAKAARCLTESIESIKAYAEPGERAALIAESTEQAKAWLAKQLAKADAEADDHDEADDDDRRNRNLARIEREGEHEDEDEDDGDDDDGEHTVEHHASRVADLLVEAGTFKDRQGALAHLLHSHDGAALLHRMRTTKGANMAKKDTWQSVVKKHGIVAIAKMIAADGDAYGLDEHAFTALITEHAKRLYPDMRPDAAFAKLYSGADGIALRKAMPIIVSLQPMTSGGVDEQRAAIEDTEASEAYKQLQEIGRQKWPTASEAQQFARAMTEHPALANKVHKRPEPTTSYPFPR